MDKSSGALSDGNLHDYFSYSNIPFNEDAHLKVVVFLRRRLRTYFMFNMCLINVQISSLYDFKNLIK